MTLGEQIRQGREAKRITLRFLARAIGVSAPYLSDIEHDRQIPTAERREKIAHLLGLDPALLEAATGYTRELADWIAKDPDLVAMLRRSRSSGQPLRIGGADCRCCRSKP